MSNLAIRSLVAVAGIPLILGCAFAGGFFFFALMVVVSTVCLYEFYALAQKRGASPQVGVGILFGFLLTLVFLHERMQYLISGLFSASVPLPTMSQAFLVVTLGFLVLIVVIELFRKSPSPLVNAGTTVFGALYVSGFFGSLVGLREIFVPSEFPVGNRFGFYGLDVPQEVVETIDLWGGLTVGAVFASIWVCDSAAYFAGRALGKHKLFERVSPNKTWEGAIAGFLAAVAMFVLLKLIALPYLTGSEALLCGAIVGAFGQIGDLIESQVKRDSGVKDSSTLIPGHGGMLDRFDSVMLVSPILFLYFDFIVFAR